MSMIFMLSTLLLSACGPVSSLFDSDQKAPKTNVSKAPSQPATGGSLPPLSAPPGFADRASGSSAQPGQVRTSDGLPALQPLGVNTNALFGQPLTDKDDRLDRLEDAVQTLRNDFDTISPAIVRLVAIESDIQDLIQQLEVLLRNEPAPAPARQIPNVASVPVPLEARPPQNLNNNVAQAPIVSTPPPSTPARVGGAQVFDLRVGEHADKTRIVLDVTEPTSFSTDIDNGERILVVDLPAATWTAAREKSFSRSPYLSSYRVEQRQGGGTLVVMQLKQSASILFSGKLPAARGSGQRLVIDLGNGNAVTN